MFHFLKMIIKKTTIISKFRDQFLRNNYLVYHCETLDGLFCFLITLGTLQSLSLCLAYKSWCFLKLYPQNSLFSFTQHTLFVGSFLHSKCTLYSVIDRILGCSHKSCSLIVTPLCNPIPRV